MFSVLSDIKFDFFIACAVKSGNITYRISVTVYIHNKDSCIADTNNASERVSYNKFADTFVGFTFEIDESEFVFCRKYLFDLGNKIFFVECLVYNILRFLVKFGNITDYSDLKSILLLNGNDVSGFVKRKGSVQDYSAVIASAVRSVFYFGRSLSSVSAGMPVMGVRMDLFLFLTFCFAVFFFVIKELFRLHIML